MQNQDAVEKPRGGLLCGKVRTCGTADVPQLRSGRKKGLMLPGAALGAAMLLAGSAAAQSFFFSTGAPDGLMATASRQGTGGSLEIESADDFSVPTEVSLNHATFTGLLPSGAKLSDINQVTVEIYRVFPKDSGPFDNRVPTRVNSPSDVAFASRDSASSSLTFSASVLQNIFTAGNSVLNGINPKPGNVTLGEGPVTGQEVLFTVNFNPLDLPADAYFFIPQVKLNNGDFFWLSAPKPITAPGTPFSPDRQSWIRNGDLDPDWLRIGADIVGGNPAPAFNASFSLSGTVADSSSTAGLLVVAFVGFLCCTRQLRSC